MARKEGIWVIIHCEWMGSSTHPHVDEMVFHVASTLGRAERYVREHHGMPYSWWKLQSFYPDVARDDPKTRIYTHLGRPAKDPPWKWAMHHYVQYARKEGW
jgi:hypothetical protein